MGAGEAALDGSANPPVLVDLPGLIEGASQVNLYIYISHIYRNALCQYFRQCLHISWYPPTLLLAQLFTDAQSMQGYHLLGGLSSSFRDVQA